MSSKLGNTKDDDVLDFINSLPDSKPSTPKPTNNQKATNSSGDNKEDLFEFLDELEEHEKKRSKIKYWHLKLLLINNNNLRKMIVQMKKNLLLVQLLINQILPMKI